MQRIDKDEEDCKNEHNAATNQPRMVERHHNFTVNDNGNLVKYDEHGEAMRMCDPENASDRNEEEV